MATYYNGSPIIDPDQLAYTVNPPAFVDGVEEILIDTTAKTIALKIAGNLGTDGATIKSVYSKLKDAWRADSTLIKYPFPMGPITDEQFELVNGWNWDKTGSVGVTVLSASWAANVVTFNTTRTGWTNVSVASASWAANVVTFNTATAHNLVNGQLIVVTGVTPSGYNGTYTVTVVDTDTFTAELLADPGTYTSGGTLEAAHGLTSGDVVTIASVTPAGYNGTYEVTVVDGNTVTASLTTDPGTYTSGGTVSNFLLTPNLLRTGGWSVVNTSGLVTEQWAGIITLGTFAANTDQAYIQQAATGGAATAVNIKLTNPVNQAVQILDDPNGDGSYVDGFDYRSYFKIFVREWQKLYAQSELFDIGVSQLTYQAYRFPLTNSADLKVTHTEVQIDANADGTPDVGVYTNINITYLRHTDDTLYNVVGDWVSGTVYAVADVTQSANGHWYKCIDPTTAGDTTEPESDATNWAAYEGERLIGSLYYPFTVIVDGDTTVGSTASGAARAAEIYEAVQYYLRQSTDIDADATASVIGKTAPALLKFVGDTLVTSNGVYIDSFNTQDTNAIEFYDAMGVKRTFPYVAALTVFFGENLQNDQYAKYWVFFTNDDAGDNSGNDYGTSGAIIVKDKDNVDMTGTVNSAWPTKRASVSHSFNYDSNIQRGAASAGFDAPITAVGIGLITGQFVRATGTIQRSTANSVTLTSALERNYSQGTTYP